MATIGELVARAGDEDRSAEQRRAAAVGAALEVIAVRAASSDGTALGPHFNNLANYADTIQEALETKD